MTIRIPLPKQRPKTHPDTKKYQRDRDKKKVEQEIKKQWKLIGIINWIKQ